MQLGSFAQLGFFDYITVWRGRISTRVPGEARTAPTAEVDKSTS